MKQITTFTTGSQRGYIHVAARGVNSGLCPIPADLTGTRGNYRKAMELFSSKGATHYAVAWYQGVPCKGYSNQYCYAVYTAYADDEQEKGVR
nr:MAG TPA: hypothetical protein [Caudoviricetes sp.]